jgi:hypothetical protein
MSEQHKHSFGTTVKYGPAGGAASIPLTDVMSVKPPSTEAGESNDTTLTSTGAVGQSSAGWLKPSDCMIKCYLMDAQIATLLNLKGARATLPWLIGYAPTGSQSVGATIGFQGWIKGMPVDEAAELKDDKVAYEMTVHMTGEETYTAGS